MRRAGTPTHPGGWRGSAAQIAVGRAAIRAYNKRRHLAPKCGAKAKSHGGPCGQIAMANGRCYIHGGRVPSGDGYHLPVWPNGKAPGAIKKLNRKLNDLQRAAAKQAKRVSAMTPAERAAYEQWKKTHKPGSAVARTRARRERQDAKDMRAMIEAIESRPKPAPTTEAAELDRFIADLKAARDQLLAPQTAQVEYTDPGTETDTETNDLGAFG